MLCICQDDIRNIRIVFIWNNTKTETIPWIIIRQHQFQNNAEKNVLCIIGMGLDFGENLYSMEIGIGNTWVCIPLKMKNQSQVPTLLYVKYKERTEKKILSIFNYRLSSKSPGKS
jgi:hypothetical protein